MTSQPNPPSQKPPEAPGSAWQLKMLIGIITIGVLALILKTLGLF